MIKTALICLFLTTAAGALDGPDFMLMGINYTPDRDAFNLYSAYREDDGFKALFQDASLYDIGCLRWTYAGLRYSYSCWTLAGAFRTYGINDLYESVRYAVIAHRLFFERYSLGVGYTRYEKNFGAGFYKASADMLQFSLGVNFEPVSFAAGMSDLSLKGDDPAYGDPEIYFAGSWPANESLTIFGLYYRDSFSRDRFLFGQNLNLNRTVNIGAGLMSGPEVYFIGVEVIYKSFNFGYTFYELSGLPNCSKVTLSYR